MNKNSKIYIADHEGFFGGAILAALKRRGHRNILLRRRKELDLRSQSRTAAFFKRHKPEYVFLSYQKSGGIMANLKSPADFIYDNIISEANVVHAAATNGAKKLLLFGASCIYPETARQPIEEKSFLKGPVEKTSEAYAVAKIAGIELGRAYKAQYGMKCVAVVPATAYGPGANFDPANAHVLTALMQKFYDAVTNHKKEVVVWGSGKPMREFIYIDDLADACVLLMEGDAGDIINVGSGEEISVRNLALLLKRVSGYGGKVVFDRTKPDGAVRKLLLSRKARRFGWKPRVKLEEGAKKTYNWHKACQKS